MAKIKDGTFPLVSNAGYGNIAIKIGNKYRFVSGKTDTTVIITEPPIKNNAGFLEYGAEDEKGNYRICFNDELFELTTPRG